MSNPIFVYDVTIPADVVSDRMVIEDWLKENTKKWCYQKEKGEETGYLHWQLRFSLNDKQRIKQVIDAFQAMDMAGCHVSPTSEAGAKAAQFYKYCTKGYTRIEGPYADNIKPKYMSAKVKKMLDEGLRPWQKQVLESDPEQEVIHVIVDEDMDGWGKSSMVDWVLYFNNGLIIPSIWDTATKIMGYVFQSHHVTDGRLYLVDMPRAEDSHAKQKEMYSALEMIKNGHICDWRQGHVGMEQIPPPSLWVFCNKKPNLKLLSPRKWRIYTVERETYSLRLIN